MVRQSRRPPDDARPRFELERLAVVEPEPKAEMRSDAESLHEPGRDEPVGSRERELEGRTGEEVDAIESMDVPEASVGRTGESTAANGNVDDVERPVGIRRREADRASLVREGLVDAV